MRNKKQGPGYLVITKTGKKGRTYHSNELINGKVPVYIEGDDNAILCSPEGLKLIGFID